MQVISLASIIDRDVIFPYQPDTTVYIYSESGRQRLVIPHAEDVECDIVGDPNTVRSILNNSTSYTYVNRQEFQRLVKKCEDIHIKLYRDTTIIGEENEFSDRMDNLFPNSRRRKSQSSFWSKNIFNQLLIMPGTKWCGQGGM